MKKRIKIILCVIASVLLLGTIFGVVDYNRVNNDKLPIFVIHIPKDGNWNEYYGLGYVVAINEDCQGDYVKFGPYFSAHACFIGMEQEIEGEQFPPVE
jgi:hypothetical protein